jgi:hypothetical protein
MVMSLALLFSSPLLAISDTELGRIESLLQKLGSSQGVTFIRNEKDFPASRAVSHLRRKLSHTKDKLTSAEEFIDEVASNSSISGKPYFVRLNDGTTLTAKEYFHSILADIDSEK